MVERKNNSSGVCRITGLVGRSSCEMLNAQPKVCLYPGLPAGGKEDPFCLLPVKVCSLCYTMKREENRGNGDFRKPLDQFEWIYERSAEVPQRNSGAPCLSRYERVISGSDTVEN